MPAFPSISIASGKGGTGKTTVAVHLASALSDQGIPVHYLDCDVEEPNGHLFLSPRIDSSENTGIPVPVVDSATCTSCGRCAAVCEFNAIAMLKKPLVFPELCHGCGACALACPAGAIREIPRNIGVVETGCAEDIAFTQGRLNVGEPMSPPLIRRVKAQRIPEAIALLDAPPGTSCPVATTVRGTDFLVLVTEPTPFGLHDLSLAVDTFQPWRQPMGVVINRADNDPCVRDYCRAKTIPLLAELPDDRRVAETYARGMLLFDGLPEWRRHFELLWERIRERL